MSDWTWIDSSGATRTRADLDKILDDHRKWLRGEEGGDRASLDGARLDGARLDGARLDYARLVGASLDRAGLDYARLVGARLDGARLDYARLVGASLDRAGLDYARLVGARLDGARLDYARLVGASLDGARLDGASLDRAYIAPSVTFKTYVEEVVPALLVAGGKTLDEVANPTVWDCHSWKNCPMHVAFGVNGIGDVPPLYRAEADRFVKLFDAKAIPLGRVNPKFKDAAPATSCEVKS